MFILKRIEIGREVDGVYLSKTLDLDKNIGAKVISKEDMSAVKNIVMFFKVMLDKSIGIQFIIPNILQNYIQQLDLIYEEYECDSFNKESCRYYESVPVDEKTYSIEYTTECIVERYDNLELHHSVDAFGATDLIQSKLIDKSILMANITKNPFLLAVIDTLDMFSLSFDSNNTVNGDIRYNKYVEDILKLDNALIICNLDNFSKIKTILTMIYNQVITENRKFGNLPNLEDAELKMFCYRRFMDITASKFIFILPDTEYSDWQFEIFNNMDSEYSTLSNRLKFV